MKLVKFLLPLCLVCARNAQAEADMLKNLAYALGKIDEGAQEIIEKKQKPLFEKLETLFNKWGFVADEDIKLSYKNNYYNNLGDIDLIDALLKLDEKTLGDVARKLFNNASVMAALQKELNDGFKNVYLLDGVLQGFIKAYNEGAVDKEKERERARKEAFLKKLSEVVKNDEDDYKLTRFQGGILNVITSPAGVYMLLTDASARGYAAIYLNGNKNIYGQWDFEKLKKEIIEKIDKNSKYYASEFIDLTSDWS